MNNFVNQLLSANPSRAVSLPNPVTMNAIGNRSVDRGFDALQGLGDKIKKRRIDSDVANVVSNLGDITDPEQYQKALFSGLGSIEGVNATEALGLASTLSKPAFDQRAYGDSRIDATNLNAYRSSRQGFAPQRPVSQNWDTYTNEDGKVFMYDKKNPQGTLKEVEGAGADNTAMPTMGATNDVDTGVDSDIPMFVKDNDIDFSGPDAGYENAQGVRVDAKGRPLTSNVAGVEPFVQNYLAQADADPIDTNYERTASNAPTMPVKASTGTFTPELYSEGIQSKLDTVKEYDSNTTRDLAKYQTDLMTWAGSNKNKQARAKVAYSNAVEQRKGNRTQYDISPQEKASMERIDALNDVMFNQSKNLDKSGTPNDKTKWSYRTVEMPNGQSKQEVVGITTDGKMVDSSGKEVDLGVKEPTLLQKDKQYINSFGSVDKAMSRVTDTIGSDNAEDIFGPVDAWFDRKTADKDFFNLSGIGQLLSLGDSEKAGKFDSDTSLMMSKVIKSMGANPSDRDLRLLEQQIPQRSDEISTANQKMNNFKEVYYDIQANTFNRLLDSNPSSLQQIIDKSMNTSKSPIPGYDLVKYKNGSIGLEPIRK